MYALVHVHTYTHLPIMTGDQLSFSSSLLCAQGGDMEWEIRLSKGGELCIHGPSGSCYLGFLPLYNSLLCPAFLSMGHWKVSQKQSLGNLCPCGLFLQNSTCNPAAVICEFCLWWDHVEREESSQTPNLSEKPSGPIQAPSPLPANYSRRST